MSSSPSLANFDRVARIYRWAEYLLLGPLLKRTREHLLQHLASARHALVLGDGDGRFTAKLLQTHPVLQVTAIDTSAVMLRLLYARCARLGLGDRLHVVQASVTDPLPASATLKPDLVVTHFVLDCLTQPEVELLARRLAAIVAPGSLWLVSDFAVPSRQPWRFLGALYIRLLYLAFRALTGLRVQRLPTPGLALSGAGFARLQRVERLEGLLYTELWQLPSDAG